MMPVGTGVVGRTKRRHFRVFRSLFAVTLTAPGSLFAETPELADIEARHRQAISQTIYGGTSEVHKGIIAQFALGMPKST